MGNNTKLSVFPCRDAELALGSEKVIKVAMSAATAHMANPEGTAHTLAAFDAVGGRVFVLVGRDGTGVLQASVFLEGEIDDLPPHKLEIARQLSRGGQPATVLIRRPPLAAIVRHKSYGQDTGQ